MPELWEYERYPADVYLLEMEYMAQEDGWMRLDKAAIQDWAGAEGMLEAAVGALHECSGQQAVHGDLRGPNIMVK